MKIDYAIMSSNKNPFYLDFWPIVAAKWKKMGIKPVLIIIGDKNRDYYDDGNGLVKEIKKLANASEVLQSQLARMYFTKDFSEYFCILTDIDLLPISKDYFTNKKVTQNSDSVIVYGSDYYQEDNQRYILSYNLAKGSVFQKVFSLNGSFKDFIELVQAEFKGWDADERYLYAKLQPYQHKILLKRRQTTDVNYFPCRRIDRDDWKYDAKDVYEGQFDEVHLIRPYSMYKKQIEYLLDLIDGKPKTPLEHTVQKVRRFIYRNINPELTNRMKGRIGRILKKVTPRVYFALKKRN